MKTYYVISLVIMSSLILTQCKKSESSNEKHTVISYPLNGSHGSNILSLDDSSVISPLNDFSLAATLEADATLKIIIKNLSSGSKAVWFYDPESNQNWNISSYDFDLGQQIFTSSKGSSLDLLVTFADTLGKCRIDFYENNSETMTKSKILIWHLSND